MSLHRYIPTKRAMPHSRKDTCLLQDQIINQGLLFPCQLAQRMSLIPRRQQIEFRYYSLGFGKLLELVGFGLVGGTGVDEVEVGGRGLGEVELGEVFVGGVGCVDCGPAGFGTDGVFLGVEMDAEKFVLHDGFGDVEREVVG